MCVLAKWSPVVFEFEYETANKSIDSISINYVNARQSKQTMASSARQFLQDIDCQ